MRTLLSKQGFVNQLTQEPLLLHPDYKPTGLIVALERSDTFGPQETFFTVDTMLAEGKPYRVREDNIAVIPVHGYLAHRDHGHIPGFYTGYDYITDLIEQALADDSIAGIVLDVNSPGGMVNGAFETADAIRNANAQKPVRAIVDSSGYSAAYLLSSAAGSIDVPKTGGVGSIGVVTMHVDMSKMLEDWGIKVTMLYAGEQKVDGHPYAPLSDDAKSRVEARLQQSYNLFVNTVAENRGLDSDAVVATQAGIFQGEKAKQVGLVDAVRPPSAAFTAFANELVNERKGAFSMGNENTATAEVAPEQQISAAQAEAKTSERQRISAIMESDEAVGRESLAKHIAFGTDMTVDAAKQMLAAAPKQEVNKAEDTSFVAVMDNSEHPAVGAEEASDTSEEDTVTAIVSDYRNFTGRK